MKIQSKNILTLGKAYLCFSLAMMAMTATAQNVSTIKQAGNIIPATDGNIQYVGRVSFRNPQSPSFTFPGVQIRAAFTGTSLKMIAKPKSGYFMVRIDGSKAFKVGFNSERDSVVSLAAALPEGRHEVNAMYVTEGYERIGEFRGFILDENAKMLEAPAMPERKIEFIGNSITCGYGVEDTDRADHFQDETCNHYYTYANLTAQALGAIHQVVARSGIGVYRCYDGPVTGDSINMNTEYTHTLLYDKTENWDFSRYTPQLVCINLGTNDTSTKGADPKLLKQGYVNLVKQVRDHYPKAKIVLLSGSMMGDDALILAKKTMDEVMNEAHKKGDKEIYRFDMSFQTGDLGYGADWHPSVAQHQKMASELIPFLKNLMNW